VRLAKRASTAIESSKKPYTRVQPQLSAKSRETWFSHQEQQKAKTLSTATAGSKAEGTSSAMKKSKKPCSGVQPELVAKPVALVQLWNTAKPVSGVQPIYLATTGIDP